MRGGADARYPAIVFGLAWYWRPSDGPSEVIKSVLERSEGTVESAAPMPSIQTIIAP
jgi:hypothetical protein